MHIILLILKIIGIVLVSLIGVFLALILLGLFVPLRYNIKGEKGNEQPIEADVRVNWLLHIVSFSLKYKEKVSYRLRIFGFTVLKGEDDFSSEEDRSSKEGRQQGQPNKKVKKKEKSARHEAGYRKKTSELRRSKEKDLDVTEQHSLNEKKQEKMDCQNEYLEAVFEEEDTKISPLKTIKKDHQPDEEHKTQENPLEIEINETETGNTKTEKLRERIRQFFVYNWNKAKKLFYKVKQFCIDLCKKKEQAVEVFGIIKDFFQAKENKAGLGVLWKQVKKLGKHCGPKKWDYKVRFGTGDPARTGQILGIISGVGGMIGIMPNITPEFQEEVLEGDFFLKGRIQIYYLSWLLIGIWKNEDFHKLKNNFEKIRRNLDGRE